MSDRSYREKLADIRSFAGKLRDQSPAIVEEFSSWIETKSPWLSRRFLGAASNLTEPFTAGMGLEVAKLGEDVVEVKMPGSWRNQGNGGAVHRGALLVVGEFAQRTFWEFHLDLKVSEFEAKKITVRTLARPTGNMKAVFRMPVAERESLLHQVRSDGRADIQCETQIYDAGGRLVAEVCIEGALSRQLAIGSVE